VPPEDRGDPCWGKEAARVLEAAAAHGRVAVVTHRNADPDAIAASIAAKSLLEAMGARACIALPEGASRASKRLLSRAGVEVGECGDPEGAESILVVDASNTTQLGGLAPLARSKPLYLIDHHAPGDLAELAREALVAKAVSATQHVVHAAHSLGFRLPGGEATVALGGIIYDSKRFQIADRCSFLAAALLVEWGGDYDAALEALTPPRERGRGMEYSERVARLKAAQRLVFSRVCGELIVAVTHVSAFESSAARALLDLGADVAVVVGGGGELRASVRLSRRAVDSGIRASEVAEYIASKLGGKGGGHDAAGMAHISGDVSPGEAVEALARSLPGKIARICTARRGAGGGAGEG